MNYLNEPNANLKRVKRGLLVGLSSLVLAACGGGGGGGESSSSSSPQEPSTSPTSFAPEEERLLASAESSKGLYVEEDFTFDHARTTRLSVRIVDDMNQAKANARLKVYLIDTSTLAERPEVWQDELSGHASLLTGGMSDQQGEFNRIIEFPKGEDAPLILIELNTLGIENKKLISIDSSHTHVDFS